MNKIKILAPHEAAKVAAGEVIERPANILKELLENSLDAGARHITIYVEEAGKKLIRVIDDGCGMSQDDIVLSVMPHATSKIVTVDDLVGVATYGFRGEALASIAAVSRLSITSRDESSDYAWQVVFEHSEKPKLDGVAAEQGTDIQVLDLFFNVPARKKFLKQDETEWNQIQQLVHALALSHLNITFKVYHNNKIFLHAPAVPSLQERIAQIWGRLTALQFLNLEQEDATSVKVVGVITNHQVWRYGKHQIFFFVNGRWVKDNELIKALFKGYNNVLPQGKFPAGVIMIEIDPAVVDVNVHPKKEEVRFTKPLIVTQTITRSVLNTLRNNTIQKVSSRNELDASFPRVETEFLEFQEKKGIKLPVEDEQNFSTSRIVVDSTSNDINWLDRKKNLPVFHELGNVFKPRVGQAASSQKDLPSDAQHSLVENISDEKFMLNGRIVGQVLKTYVILETQNGLILIDQHAAHERVLYEQMKDTLIARQSSLLVFPHAMTMTKDELDALDRFEKGISFFGLTFSRIGHQSLAISALPLGVSTKDAEELFRTMAALIIEKNHFDEEHVHKILYEHMHSHLACKKAVKAGDMLTLEQIEKLIEDLSKVEKPFICIHGRPTYWMLEQSELEKFFRR